MQQRQISFVALITVLAVAAPIAQSKQPPSSSEWGQFEQLAMQPRGGLSPDGKWLAYGVNRSSRDNDLRVRNLASGSEQTIAFGATPAFSADSRWIAYAIGYSEAQEERMRTQRRPIHRKLGVLKLDGESKPVTMEGIESFAFDPSGAYLLMRRYAPERPGAAAGGGAPPAPATPPPATADDPAPVGVTILVRDLATGRDAVFGNVSEASWPTVVDRSKIGPPLLAFIISAEDKIGNGVNLYNAATGAHRVLDSSNTIYSGLTWRRDADDLVVLRAQADDRREGSTHVGLAWLGVRDTPTMRTLDPREGSKLPPGTRIVAFRRPAWSDDGKILFLGVAPWEERTTPVKPAGESTTPPQPGVTPPPADTTNEDTASVDIWHARDIEVMPRQKLSARTDRQRNRLVAWHLADGKLVALGAQLREFVAPLRSTSLAYALTWPTYAMDRTIGRPSADVALINLSTGERTVVAERIDDTYQQASPRGRYLLFFREGHFWTIDTKSRAVTNITKSAATSFVNKESDDTSAHKPPFGIAGWTKDDEAVLLYDKFDIWQVAADGAKATRLTDGTAEQVRHRYVRVDPDEEFIDTGRPIFVSLFGLWSKKSGYGSLSPSGSVSRLIFNDKAVTALAKAREADVYAYLSQAFDDSPDIFVGGPDLKASKQATNSNAFLSKFAWGRAEIVEFKSARGERLQGALYYPAGYEAGKKYPMVVYLYEKLSDGVHRFVAPSERDYYNAAVFTSQGYLLFQPDIVFRPREPGLSVVECVEPAVKRVVAMGVADPARVGVVGHSWGGFDAAYLATHSTVFAASVAGAAITNLVSNYGNHHWSSGIAETDHIETGQQRMEVPIYEDLQAYIRNSAVFNVQNMSTPLMLMTGDNDGTVHWHQAVELYNIARRAKKQVVMLAYGGEDHGLRRKANQIDYQRRILQWFGHYLKNEPAPGWITDGMSFLDREQELKRAKAKKGTF